MKQYIYIVIIALLMGLTSVSGWLVMAQNHKLTDSRKQHEADAKQYEDLTEAAAADALEAQSLYAQVWQDGYMQATMDIFYKVPQIIIQKDEPGTLAIWRKSGALPDPVKPEETTSLMPDNLPVMPKPAKKH